MHDEREYPRFFESRTLPAAHSTRCTRREYTRLFSTSDKLERALVSSRSSHAQFKQHPTTNPPPPLTSTMKTLTNHLSPSRSPPPPRTSPPNNFPLPVPPYIRPPTIYLQNPPIHTPNLHPPTTATRPPQPLPPTPNTSIIHPLHYKPNHHNSRRHTRLVSRPPNTPPETLRRRAQHAERVGR